MRDHIFSLASSLLMSSQIFAPSAHMTLPSLVLSDSLSKSPEPVCHDAADCDEVPGGSEATDRQVSAILNWLVAAGWRHVLRHDCGA